MASIAIVIGVSDNARFVVASSEREAALKAESVLATFARGALPVPVTIGCVDPAIADRLMNYLADVQMELVLSEAA